MDIGPVMLILVGVVLTLMMVLYAAHFQRPPHTVKTIYDEYLKLKEKDPGGDERSRLKLVLHKCCRLSDSAIDEWLTTTNTRDIAGLIECVLLEEYGKKVSHSFSAYAKAGGELTAWDWAQSARSSASGVPSGRI